MADSSDHRVSRATVVNSREVAAAEPPPGAERDGTLTATDSTGSKIRQGRPNGGRGARRMGGIHKRQDVCGIPPCNRSRVGIAGPVLR